VQIGVRRELVAVRSCMQGVRVDRGRMDIGKPSALRLLLICRRPPAVGIALQITTRHPRLCGDIGIPWWVGEYGACGGGAGSGQSSSSAPLILASKSFQDRWYSNLAWAKLSGLPPREIGQCERALPEWRLWVGKTSASAPTSRLEPRAKAPSCYQTLNAHQIHVRPSSNPYDSVPLFQEECSKVILSQSLEGITVFSVRGMYFDGVISLEDSYEN